MRGMKNCAACGASIGNAAKRCRHCGHGKASEHQGGYRRVYVPGHPAANCDGYALEHRYVLYEAGLRVPDGWHVHHLDGDKTNNELDNLAILKDSAHHRMHVREAGHVVNQFGIWPLKDVAA